MGLQAVIDENQKWKKNAHTAYFPRKYLGGDENILPFNHTFIDFRIDGPSNGDFIGIGQCGIDVPISAVDGIFYGLFTVTGTERAQSNNWNVVATIQTNGRRQYSITAAHTKLFKIHRK